MDLIDIFGFFQVFSIAHTTSIAIAADNGYGNQSLLASRLLLIKKAIYIANLTMIGTLYFSKMSTAIFILLLRGFNFRSGFPFLAVITIWAFSSLLVSAFQCGIPHPWDLASNKCINMRVWQNYFTSMNIVTEVALILWPTYMVCRIQMRLQKKAIVIGCFTLRATIILSAILEAIYRNKTVKGVQSIILDPFPVSVCTEVLLFTTIIAPCVPHLKSVMESLQSGGFRLYQCPRKQSGQSDEIGLINA